MAASINASKNSRAKEVEAFNEIQKVKKLL